MENKLYIVNVEAAIYKGNRWLIIRRSDKEDHAPVYCHWSEGR